MEDLIEKLNKKNTPALKFVCVDLECSPTKDGRLLKFDWAKALGNWVCPLFVKSSVLTILLQRLKQPLRPTTSPPVRTGTATVMQRIREVISTTNTPSWVNSVPSNFGDSSAGTLKADEWRTMISIYLPIALISLWGSESYDQPTHPPRLRRILDHTMLLVSAVLIVSFRTTTTSRARAYEDYMVRYIRDMKELFPEAGYRPNHHMAIHVSDFLRLYGPAHSWWCFPFERLVGQLQRLPTNHHFGEIS